MQKRFITLCWVILPGGFVGKCNCAKSSECSHECERSHLIQSWASANSRLVTAASAQNLPVHQIQGLWCQKSHNLWGFTRWHIHSVMSRQWFSSRSQWLCRKQETSICCMSLDMDTEMFRFDWCLVLCIYFKTPKLRLAFATQLSSWQQQQNALRERQFDVSAQNIFQTQSDLRQRHANMSITQPSSHNMDTSHSSVYCVARYDRCQGSTIYVLSAFSVSSTAGVLIHESR